MRMAADWPKSANTSVTAIFQRRDIDIIPGVTSMLARHIGQLTRGADVTETPAGPSAMSSPGGGPRGSVPVLVVFAGPGRQRRVTVGFRAFMIIPHAIALWALSIAAAVVAVPGWFGALATGRLPEFAADFLSGYLRWRARVLAYWLLLTDAYPPFSMDDAGYPVQVALAPGRLNRLAVFFRLILAIPAWLMATLLTYGTSTAVLFVTWLIVLASGRMPVALHQALAAVTRYVIRYDGYLLMLTGRYPRGAFGDRPEAAGPDTSPGAPDPDAVGTPASAESADAPDTPASAETAGAPDAPDAPRPWRLVLSSGAKWLVACILALGVVTAAVYAVWVTSLASTVSRKVSTVVTADEAIAELNAAYAPLGKAVASFRAGSSTCRGSTHPLRCLTATDRQLAGSFATFGAKLWAIRMPGGPAAAAAAKLGGATRQAEQDLRILGSATTLAQYQLMLSYPQFAQAIDRFGQDYNNLGTALTNASRHP